MKPTTKVCTHCGGEALVHLRSINLKVCGDCRTEMPWFLDEGQKPLVGPSRQIVSHAPPPQPKYDVQYSPRKDRLWVHCDDGSTVGRFSSMGIDIHTSADEQAAGAGQCLYCTHQPTTVGDWHLFRAKARELWGVDIPANSILPRYLKDGPPSLRYSHEKQAH